MSKLTLVFPIALILLLLMLFGEFLRIALRRDALAEGAQLDSQPARLGFFRRRYPMERRDIIAVLVIMIVYGAVAFTGLGDNTAPESFCRFVESGRYVQIELDEETEISGILYYSGLYHGASYYFQFSADGENWTDVSTMEQGHADLFKWHDVELGETNQSTKYVRIISGGLLEMGELALYDGGGNLVPTFSMTYDEGCTPLFDEQDTVPAEGETYLNSSYFDEIYHARTAYENITEVYPYEITHPPLGKLIISVGIRIFGMTPFGWRFMGTLFGVLMLAFLYVFLKNMFGSTAIAVCGTLLFAFDFMHYVQTRIATIDTYAVFFILGMYFFMYRYITVDRDDPLVPAWRWRVPLFFCGLFFGLGAASKWTVIYGGAGLAVIWGLRWIFRGRDLIGCGRKKQFFTEFTGDVGLCLLVFIVMPCLIYYVSYYPYGKASGMSGISMFFDADYLETVISNQKYMLNYHVGVDATHPYSSNWYQWIVDARPILYYVDYTTDTTKSTFAAFFNPFVCWAGLLAMIGMAVLVVKKKDGKAMFILLGYLAQLVPWLLVSRVVFIYHYFPCLIFLVLAICHAFDIVRQRVASWRKPVYGLTGLSVGLFAVFYPVLSGIEVPVWYTHYFLKWFLDAWPF